MIRDLSASDEARRTVTCGVCIVGGGIAGLMVAARLHEPRLVVLESGGLDPLPKFDALNAVEQSEPLYQNAIEGRVRALGGTSHAWGGRMLPLTANDIGARDYLGLSGWPIKKTDLDRFTPDIERLFGLNQSAYDPPWSHGDLSARWTKWPMFHRRNIVQVLGGMLKAKRSPEIWVNATACHFEVDVEAGRILAVTARSFNGKRLTVRADRFVLATGTLETTRLLLLLDDCTGKRAFAGCDALGRYFNDHLKMDVGRLRVIDRVLTNKIFGIHINGSTRRALHLETTASAQRDDRAASGYMTVRYEFQPMSIYAYVRNLGKAAQRRQTSTLPIAETMMNFRSVASVLYWRLRHRVMYLDPTINIFVEARIEQIPHSASRLSLSMQRDAFGVPILKIDWHKTRDDLHTFQSLLRRARQFWRSSSLDATSPVDWTVEWDADDLLDRAMDTSHPAGSARMGLDPRTSVVNPRLACHAAPSLFIASAAVFPASGSANPTLTILQIACMVAERLSAGR